MHVIRKYRRYIIPAVLCIIVLGGIFIKFNSNKTSASQQSFQYAIAEVQRGNIQVSVSGTGTIATSVRKEIMTLNNGTVDMIFVSEGEPVNEGDLILSFENDTVNTVIEQAQLNVTIAENSLKELQEDLKNLKIYAPNSGVIGSVNTSVGEELSKGFLLTTITDKSKMEAAGQFNQEQIKNIKVGDKVEVFLYGSLSTVNGIVKKITETPTVDASGAILYEVTVEVDNPGGLASGMKVQITVVNSKGSFMSLENSELKAKEPYEVKLLTGGTITKLNISSGDYVQKGDLIAELENPSLLTQVANQEIKVEQSRLELKDKLDDRDNTAVYAPVSGVITKINVTQGEQVRENSVVAVVSDLNNLEVVIPVDELDINKVQVGQEAVITVEAAPGKRYNAQVTKIALEGSATGGVTTFDVTLQLKDTKGLRPGMTANGEILISKKDDVLLLPIEAIQQRGNRRFVITSVENKEQPDTTPVEIGLVSENYVEITEGLHEGDRVFYPLSGRSTSQYQQRGLGMGMIRAGERRPPGGMN
jgi:HlyD family secretion protein